MPILGSVAGIPCLTCSRWTRALIALALTASIAAAVASPAAAKMRSKKIDHHLCKTVGGGRFVDIPGFPGEKIDRRLLADIRWMKRRYDIFITDGYSTDPAHARNGEHPIGLADRHRPQQGQGRHLEEDRSPRPQGGAAAGPPDPALAVGGLERRCRPRPRQPPPPLLDALRDQAEGPGSGRLHAQVPGAARRASAASSDRARSRERAASHRRPSGDAPRPAGPRCLTCRAGSGRSSRPRSPRRH